MLNTTPGSVSYFSPVGRQHVKHVCLSIDRIEEVAAHLAQVAIGRLPALELVEIRLHGRNATCTREPVSENEDSKSHSSYLKT